MEKLINGHKLDTTDLAPQFEAYHRSGQRIIVQFKYGEVKRGYVGKTTGWKPSYLLMATTRSIGSSDLLGHDDKIIGTVEKWRDQ